MKLPVKQTDKNCLMENDKMKGIKNGFEQGKIFVRQSTGYGYEFPFDISTCVLELLEQIYQYHLNIHRVLYPSLDQINVIFQGKEIGKQQHLGEIDNISPNSILHLKFGKAASPIPIVGNNLKQIFVSINGEVKKISLEGIRKEITVTDIEEIVREGEKIEENKEQLFIMFQSHFLERNKKLSDYGVRDSDLLEVYVQERRQVRFDFVHKESHLKPRIKKSHSREDIRDSNKEEQTSENQNTDPKNKIYNSMFQEKSKGSVKVENNFDHLFSPSDFACKTPTSPDFQGHEWFTTDSEFVKERKKSINLFAEPIEEVQFFEEAVCSAFQKQDIVECKSNEEDIENQLREQDDGQGDDGSGCGR